MQAAVRLGPITVAVDAGSDVFKFYKKGIFNHEDRCGTQLNHAISVVGYSYDEKSKDLPYWIVRNSWGEDWGEGGYIRMAITPGDGMCGINLEASFPNIYYLSVFDSGAYFTLAIVAAVLSMWPLARLEWCRPKNLQYLNAG